MKFRIQTAEFRKRQRAGRNASSRRGAGLVIALTTLLVVMLMTGAIMRSLVVGVRQSRQSATELQAQWFADAAAARAAAQLARDGQYRGESWRTEVMPGQPDGVGVAEIRVESVENDKQQRRVIVEARYPDHPWRRVVASRTFQFTIPEKQPPAGNRPEENAP